MHRSLDDSEGAVPPHGAAHIQLGGALQGEVHQGIDHIAPGVALAVGHHGDAAQRAASLDAQGYRASFSLSWLPIMEAAIRLRPRAAVATGRVL